RTPRGRPRASRRRAPMRSRRCRARGPRGSPAARRITRSLIRGGDRPARRNGIVVLAVYYVLSSLVDLLAFAQGTVGPASVPSAAIRIAVGAICLVVAWNGGRELDT